MYKGSFILIIVILIGIILAGCELPFNSDDKEAAIILEAATTTTIHRYFKANPDEKLKSDIGFGAKQVLLLLENPYSWVTYADWDGLIDRIGGNVKKNKKDLKALLSLILPILEDRAKKPIGKAVKRISRRDMMYLAAFFKGIVGACE